HDDYKDLDVKGKVVVWLGGRGPRGTDQQQAARLLRGRASFAVEEMGAAATIGPVPERGQRGGPPAQAAGGRGTPVPDFTTPERLDSSVPPNITAGDDFLEFLFSGSDIKY